MTGSNYAPTCFYQEQVQCLPSVCPDLEVRVAHLHSEAKFERFPPKWLVVSSVVLQGVVKVTDPLNWSKPQQ